MKKVWKFKEFSETEMGNISAQECSKFYANLRNSVNEYLSLEKKFY